MDINEIIILVIRVCGVTFLCCYLVFCAWRGALWFTKKYIAPPSVWEDIYMSSLPVARQKYDRELLYYDNDQGEQIKQEFYSEEGIGDMDWLELMESIDCTVEYLNEAQADLKRGMDTNLSSFSVTDQCKIVDKRMLQLELLNEERDRRIADC